MGKDRDDDEDNSLGTKIARIIGKAIGLVPPEYEEQELDTEQQQDTTLQTNTEASRQAKQTKEAQESEENLGLDTLFKKEEILDQETNPKDFQKEELNNEFANLLDETGPILPLLNGIKDGLGQCANLCYRYSLIKFYHEAVKLGDSIGEFNEFFHNKALPVGIKGMKAIDKAIPDIKSMSKALGQAAPVVTDTQKTLEDFNIVVNPMVRPGAKIIRTEREKLNREKERRKKFSRDFHNKFKSFARKVRNFFVHLPANMAKVLAVPIALIMDNIKNIEDLINSKREKPISPSVDHTPKSPELQSNSINSRVESSNPPMPQESIQQDWKPDTKVTIARYKGNTQSLNQLDLNQEASADYWHQRVGAPTRRPNGQVMTDEQIKRKADRRRKIHEEAIRIFHDQHEQDDRSAKPMIGNLPDHFGDGSAAGGGGESTTGTKRKKGAVEFTSKVIDPKKWAKSIRRRSNSSDRTPRN